MPTYLTVPEFAEESRIPEQTVRALMRQRKLSYEKLGYRTYRICRETAFKDLAKLTVKAI